MLKFAHYTPAKYTIYLLFSYLCCHTEYSEGVEGCCAIAMSMLGTVCENS